MREVIMRLTPKPFEQAEYAEIVRELVRCGECCYAVPHNRRWQQHKLWCDMHDESKDADWYCADGEKRDE